MIAIVVDGDAGSHVTLNTMYKGLKIRWHSQGVCFVDHVIHTVKIFCYLYQPMT